MGEESKLNNTAEEQEVLHDEQHSDAEVSPKKKKNKKELIDNLESELELAKDKYIRLYAEFDNYKKRTVKERLELMSTASKDVLLALLPVIDDFDRAKKMADDTTKEETFSEGVSLVYQKFKGMLVSRGVKEMESTGMLFDPEIHEAITEIPAPTEELKGKIIDTIEKGYYIHDKIIRHAKVVVGK